MIKATIFPEGTLGSTDRNQSYPPTGTHPSSQQLMFIVIYKQADSLHSLIADGQYCATSMGREKWKELIGTQASFQNNCNKEGFNVFCSQNQNSKVRIGIVSNGGTECDSCDSRIGFGTGGRPDNLNTCGNKAGVSPDNG